MVDQNTVKIISDTIVEELDGYNKATPNIDLKNNRLDIMSYTDEELVMNLLKDNLLKEIKSRTAKQDDLALKILIAAKKRVKEDLKKYQSVIKFLIAMKPFYLTAIIALMNQRPEML